jgi:SAM-dependent methyltransferase
VDYLKTVFQFDGEENIPMLQRGEDGIFYSGEIGEVSYPDEGNDACFEVEDQSFWFQYRNDCIRELVRNFPPKGNGPIFDVGGGNGFVAKGLMDAGWDVVLVEPGPAGARNAKKRGLPHVICATTQSAGFQSGTLPAIGVFDVMEHIEDDLGFLRHLWDLLMPGGMLYLTVPAFQALWSHEDVDAGHFRRYRLGSLKKKITESGFKVSYGTYIFFFLPLVVFLFRTMPFRLNLIKEANISATIHKDHSMPSGLSGAALNALLAWEVGKIKKQAKMLCGGSCMVAARKPR